MIDCTLCKNSFDPTTGGWQDCAAMSPTGAAIKINVCQKCTQEIEKRILAAHAKVEEARRRAMNSRNN